MQSTEKLKRIRHVVLDMDGTVYLGNTLLPGAAALFATLARLGLRHSFVTNNNSSSRDEYVAHLARMGVEATAEQILTSSLATVEYLRRALPEVEKVLVLGTPSLKAELQASGLRVVEENPEVPDAVIVGFDRTLNYESLARAAYWIGAGKPYIATHPDRVCPTDQPTILPDCGAICALLAAATGREPDAIPGKPDPAMLNGILAREGLAPENLAMVGDRLYTDIEMARAAGALSVLTLAGETTRADAANAAPAPDLVVGDLAELGRLLLSEQDAAS